VAEFEKWVKTLNHAERVRLILCSQFYMALYPAYNYQGSSDKKEFEQAAVDWKLDLKAIETEARNRAQRKKAEPKAESQKPAKSKAVKELAEAQKREKAKKAAKKQGK